jgi:TonB family protein
MSKNKNISLVLSLVLGISFSVVLFLFVPFISGTLQEEEVVPMLVINSIEFTKTEIPDKNKVVKEKPKTVKKIVKKPIKKIKKAKKKILAKKKVIEPIEKNFSTNKKKVTESVKHEDEVIPIPEPIYRVTEKPQMLRKGELIYPEDMKRLGLTAIVIIDALIDHKGKVRKTSIYKSAGKSFNDAAINAVNNTIFIPGKIAGKPVAVLFRLPMKFYLK